MRAKAEKEGKVVVARAEVARAEVARVGVTAEAVKVVGEEVGVLVGACSGSHTRWPVRECKESACPLPPGTNGMFQRLQCKP